jgi:hypothetical protein
MILVKLSRRSGRKFKGTMTIAQRTFHSFTVRAAGKSRVRVSAKSTIRATQAAINSSVNKILVARRACRPKEMKARSEKVIKLASRSMHFDNNLAVQAVTAAQETNAIIPHIHPAYLMPMGKLRSPTPMSTLFPIRWYKSAVFSVTRLYRESECKDRGLPT